jgi:hypothetical protein
MRINLFGGPGCAKTKTAMWLTRELSLMRHDTEYVDERVKGWDQYTIFAGQLEKEEFYLRHGIAVVVTDSPLLMQTAYMTDRDSERFVPLVLAVCKMFEEDHPSLNILLARGDIPYNPCGRWQTYAQAVELDRRIKTIMEDNLHDFYEFDAKDCDGILKECHMRLGCRTC